MRQRALSRRAAAVAAEDVSREPRSLPLLPLSSCEALPEVSELADEYAEEPTSLPVACGRRGSSVSLEAKTKLSWWRRTVGRLFSRSVSAAAPDLMFAVWPAGGGACSEWWWWSWTVGGCLHCDLLSFLRRLTFPAVCHSDLHRLTLCLTGPHRPRAFPCLHPTLERRAFVGTWFRAKIISYMGVYLYKPIQIHQRMS